MIYFECSECGQPLAASEARRGARLPCPLCGSRQLVPQQSTAAHLPRKRARAAERRAPEPPLSGKPPARPSLPEKSLADEPAAGEGRVPQWATGARSRRESHSIGEPVPAEHGGSLPPNVIILPRWSLYFQGLVIAAAALAGLVLGYAMGRNAVGQHHGEKPRDPVPVPVEVKLLYFVAPGELADDAGAVFIALPAGRRPERTLSIAGLRPQDPPPAAESSAVRAIVQFGGVYERADAEGSVAALLPNRGRYYLLLISRHSRRPAEKPIDKQHLAQVRKYFFLASQLIGSWNYQWMPVTVTERTRRLQCTFGTDGTVETMIE